MGYPMTYTRVISRNHLQGDYDSPDDSCCGFYVCSCRRFLAGDLRRLERDQRDSLHLEMYAKTAGITKKQARKVLDAFFEGFPRWVLKEFE